MTVTGATTAKIASAAYTPPYQSVNTYPAPVQVTGTATGVSNNPTGPAAGKSDSDYAWAYLQSHMMSPPSYRYAYLMWIVFALIALIYAAAHHSRLSRGSLGAGFTGWGMRRHTVGSKKPGKRNRALPSNGVMLMILLLSTVAIVLSVVGADYVQPSSSVLDFSSSFGKRATASPTAPKYTINKSLWTLGSRFGFIAFALFPLLVLFALKSPSINFLSLRLLTQLHADKLALLHRGTAWLIWGITTAHVALWTVQLFEDSRNGKPTWIYLWTNYRFIFGCVAYGALTGVMLLSLRPIRKHRYEFFYVAHVVLSFLTIAGCAVHHPVLWYWMAAAGGLWAAERIYRFLRFARINGLFGRHRSTSVLAGRPYSNLPTHDQIGMQEMKQGHHGLGNPYTEKTLPNVPPVDASRDGRGGYDAMDTPAIEFGARSDLAYFDEGSLQPTGSYDNRYTDPYKDGASTVTATLVSDSQHGHQRNKSSMGSFPDEPTPSPPPIPAGYAQAQLLPSRTIRLTIKVPHPFPWAPGQSCLLYLPDLSRIQSHPFTILNNGEPEIVLLVKARKGITRRLFELVREQSLASMGVNQVKDKRLTLASMRGGQEGGIQAPPIYVRTWVDGPFGSAARVRWNEFSSVTIICGGSGVSFGAAVCDYVCQAMSRNQGTSQRFQTQRVRFCWVAREYAEIAWVAGQLYRCQQMVPPEQLQISIFVTNATKVQDELALPRPGFAKGGAGYRRDSQDSLSSVMSNDSQFEQDEAVDSAISAESSSHYADVIDLTNYDDEEDINDPVEQQLSDKLQQQGKVRRARSRRVAKTKMRDMPKSPSYPPHRYEARYSGYSDSEVAHQYDPTAKGRYPAQPNAPRRSSRVSSYAEPHGATSADLGDGVFVPPHAAFSQDSRRQSYRSIADSTYGRYDPYASSPTPRGQSPSASMFFDDNQSVAGGESVRNLLSRASRTGSMVLLEDVGSDPTGDAGLWIDQADHAAMNMMSEMARPGKPKLTKVLEEEIELARGSMIVATCGPVTLNTVVRNLVARHISPSRIRHGDKRGHIAIYSEDYES